MHDVALWGLTEHHTYFLLILIVIAAVIIITSVAASFGHRHACREKPETDQEETS